MFSHPDPYLSQPMQVIVFYLSSQTTCIHRTRDGQTLEVWGNDLREHYLITLDSQRPHGIDIVSLDATNVVGNRKER
jgi:hypothetical protein